MRHVLDEYTDKIESLVREISQYEGEPVEGSLPPLAEQQFLLTIDHLRVAVRHLRMSAYFTSRAD